jgi:hypothetical protein
MSGPRIQIGGPTGAFIVIVAGIVAAHGLPGLLMVTMMASVSASRTLRVGAVRCRPRSHAPAPVPPAPLVDVGSFLLYLA